MMAKIKKVLIIVINGDLSMKIDHYQKDDTDILV
jgi:hypothetical protein